MSSRLHLSRHLSSVFNNDDARNQSLDGGVSTLVKSISLMLGDSSSVVDYKEGRI